MPSPTTQILGIQFFTGSLEEAIEHSLKGGLVLAPSGPGMADLSGDSEYQKALENADYNLADSGLMVMLWNLLSPHKATRISGYLYLKALLQIDALKNANYTFWVMPSEEERRINLQWLNEQIGFQLTEADTYLAPMYREQTISDPPLLEQLQQRKPPVIVINIGGGIQEKLGFYLKENLDYTPTIICTGAAIAFMTGQQANIPLWADKLYLGWFCRILQSPKSFFPRYWKAKRLIWTLLKYKERSPAG